MTEAFHLATFLTRWQGSSRHDLSASHSETLSLAALYGLATPEERACWEGLRLDYTAPYGAIALRMLIAARYDALDVDDVICCAGAQEGMACVSRALLGSGDHAVVVIPIYQPLAWTLTDRVHTTGVSLDSGNLTLDVERVAAAIRPETRLILMNFPNSPTGAMLNIATQTALVELCRARGLWLVNDEVYCHTVSDLAQRPPAVADAYERGVSINALSKGFGLPGLRVGWVACRDRSVLGRIAVAKAALSSCLTAPTEMLAQVALREAPRLIERARSVGLANRQHLDQLLCRHPDSLEAAPTHNLAFAFPRYRGAEGAKAFAIRLVMAAGTLLLPANLWRSPLGEVPGDRLRISLGQAGVAAGLAAIDAYLNDVEGRKQSDLDTSPVRDVESTTKFS